MKLKILIILSFYLFLSLSSYAQNDTYELSSNFKKIIEIDEFNTNLINADFDNIKYFEYLYYYCVVSEETEYFEEYYNWYNQQKITIEKELSKNYIINLIHKSSDEKQKKFCEELLIILHNTIFKKYDEKADKISSIIDTGEYNCVSSSIIYSVFLINYNIKSIPVKTKDHVFIKIQFANEDIDVETTNMYGFNPGDKKEVLDEFGELTGFTYVPQKNYMDRADIGLKDLLLLVYNNIINYYYQKQDYLKTINLAYIIYKCKDPKLDLKEFEIHFNNYIAGLTTQKKYKEAVSDINSYLKFIDLNADFIIFRFTLLGKYVDELNNYDNITEIENYLFDENNKFDFLFDNDKFIKIYFHFIYKIVSYYNSINDYNNSYIYIDKFYNKYGLYDNIDKIFGNILINEFGYYNKLNNFDYIEKKISELKEKYDIFKDIIIEHEKIHYYNKIKFYISDNKFETALTEAKNIFSVYPDDHNIQQALKQSYISYTVNLYKNKDIDNLINYCDESLTFFKDDNILKNNYKSFILNLAKEDIDNKNFINARKLLNIGLQRFPNDNSVIDMDEYLKSINN